MLFANKTYAENNHEDLLCRVISYHVAMTIWLKPPWQFGTRYFYRVDSSVNGNSSYTIVFIQHPNISCKGERPLGQPRCAFPLRFHERGSPLPGPRMGREIIFINDYIE
ncbi:hypothetical protein NPIL_215821 [Nephila pilipes]|uniref:Uncharacterized protein n=1 Tax=Nephila pilipes TaxID=299642 RepID=A0A8X6THK4_NEPPI|nr:hypothetical protein NPIL_215821 [Nephila pilipes]